VSSTYYALFHFLIDKTCRTIIGTRHDLSGYRYVLGRGFNHGTMMRVCRAFSRGALPPGVRRGLPSAFTVPTEIRSIAETFVVLQELRHGADYDLSETFVRADVLAQVAKVEQALRRFREVRNMPAPRFFLGCLLTWNTRAGRR